MGLRGPHFCSQLHAVNKAAVGDDGYKLTNCPEGMFDLEHSLGVAWGVDGCKSVGRN